MRETVWWIRWRGPSIGKPDADEGLWAELDNIAPLLAAWAELRESIGRLIEAQGGRCPLKCL